MTEWTKRGYLKGYNENGIKYKLRQVDSESNQKVVVEQPTDIETDRPSGILDDPSFNQSGDLFDSPADTSFD